MKTILKENFHKLIIKTLINNTITIETQVNKRNNNYLSEIDFYCVQKQDLYIKFCVRISST